MSCDFRGIRWIASELIITYLSGFSFYDGVPYFGIQCNVQVECSANMQLERVIQ